MYLPCFALFCLVLRYSPNGVVLQGIGSARSGGRIGDPTL